MRTLLIDLETSPISADVWNLWNVNVGLSQIREPTRMLCFAAKWLHDPVTHFWSEWRHGHDDMVKAAHNLLSEADVVEHYNGQRFDVPHLNREFLLAGMGPPAPFQQIDLLKVVRKQFQFPSNKLAYVSAALGYEGKLAHEGHSLWVKVLAGDPKAQAMMRRYNKRDVVALEELHDRLLPWIPGIPSTALHDGQTFGCPACGGTELEHRGYAYTAVSKFQRYRCKDCGKWSRDTGRVLGSSVRLVSV